MRLWIALLALVLSGCAALPAKQAGAFSTLAGADRDAFEALAAQENAALTDYAKGYLRRNPGSRVEVRDCQLSPALPGPRPMPACKVVLIPRTPASMPAGVTLEPISIAAAAPQTRLLIGGLADYGASMAELAEAKDLDDARAATSKVGDSVKGLVATIPGAPALAGAVIDIAVWATNQSFQQKRRKALLEAARNADGAVQTAARQMGVISLRLRENLELAALEKLTEANEAYAAAPNDQTFTALVTATAQVNAARSVRTDYSALAKGHQDLIRALEDDVDPVAALGEIQTFVSLVAAAKTAAAKDAEAS